MRIAQTLVVRNEVGLIQDHLDFHLTCGVDLFIVTDTGSTDGTVEILKDFAERGWVHLLNGTGQETSSPGLHTRMAKLAHERYRSRWVIHAEAADFFVCPGLDLRQTLLALPNDTKFLRVEGPGSSSIHGVAHGSRIIHRGVPDPKQLQNGHSVNLDGHAPNEHSIQVFRHPIALETVHGGQPYPQAKDARTSRHLDRQENRLGGGYNQLVGKLKTLKTYRTTDAPLRCNACGFRSAAFCGMGLDLPVLYDKSVVGASPRPNARCPSCNASDRERLAFAYLQRLKLSNLCTLHGAPERFLGKHLKAESREYVSFDVERKKAGMSADICRLPFRAEHFDLVVCNHVLEHVKSDRRAISELFRVLAPAGIAILQVPYTKAYPTDEEGEEELTARERETRFGQWNHVRIYNLFDYRSRLEEAGFTVELFSGDPETRRVAAFGANEQLIVAHKLPGSDPLRQGVKRAMFQLSYLAPELMPNYIRARRSAIQLTNLARTTLRLLSTKTRG